MTSGAHRLGLLGGTLDPVHVGHLEAADAARNALTLDEILVIPAHDPPHRPGDPHASAFHRFAMVALAIQGRAGYRASDMELRREGASYTAHTLRDLGAEGWRPSQLYFIVGTDAFAEIATWYAYPAILDACRFAVVARPGMTIDAALARTPDLRMRVGDSIHLVHTATSAVSSSEIRARLASGQPVDGLVPPAVARHIAVHRLYRVEEAS
ncbi:MAG: nicotinate-nucleotide adenylyltransferase [Vicinamibacterales bacterium]